MQGTKRPLMITWNESSEESEGVTQQDKDFDLSEANQNNVDLVGSGARE